MREHYREVGKQFSPTPSFDVSVTRASYIKRIDEKSVEAMDRFEAELRKPVKSVKGKVRKAYAVVPVGMA